MILAAVDRYRHVLLGSLALLYVLGFNGEWLIDSDSALYLSLARSLALGRGYTYFGATHHLVYPGLPYALSILFRLFPVHAIAGCDALIVLSGLAALALTYRLFLLRFDRATAVMVTLLTGIAHQYCSYCFNILVEIPFLLGVMALLAGYEAIIYRPSLSRWWDWALLSAGACITISTKPMMLVLLGICLLTLPWRNRRTRRKAIAIAVLLISFLLLFLCCDPRHPFARESATSYEQLAIRDLHRFPVRWNTIVVDNISDLFGRSIPRAVLGLPLGVPAISVVFSVTVLCSGIALFRYRTSWGLWVLVTAAKLVLFHSHDRYLIPILPLLMLGWWQTICAIGRCRSPALGKIAFVLLFSTTLILNCATTGIFIAQQHRQPFLLHYRGGRLATLIQMSAVIDQKCAPDEMILSMPNTSRIVSFLSNRPALEPGSALPAMMPDHIYATVTAQSDHAEIDRWLTLHHFAGLGQPIAVVPSPIRFGKPMGLFLTRGTHP